MTKTYDRFDDPVLVPVPAHARPKNLDPKVNGPFLDDIREAQEDAYRQARMKQHRENLKLVKSASDKKKDEPTLSVAQANDKRITDDDYDVLPIDREHAHLEAAEIRRKNIELDADNIGNTEADPGVQTEKAVPVKSKISKTAATKNGPTRQTKLSGKSMQEADKSAAKKTTDPLPAKVPVNKAAKKAIKKAAKKA